MKPKAETFAFRHSHLFELNKSLLRRLIQKTIKNIFFLNISKDSANKNSFFMMFRIIRSLHVQIEFFSQGYIFFTIHMT